MSEKTKCPHCKGKGEHFSPGYKCMMACPACDGRGYHHVEPKVIEDCAKCSGTGEVEPFWTKEAPKEPGFYWIQFIDGGMEIVKAVNIAGGIYWWIAGQPATTDLLPWQKQVEFWSREPIRFPEPPKEQPNDPT